MADDPVTRETPTERILATEDGRLKFLVSDALEEYRVKTLLTKEPETIQWIDSWDVQGGEAQTRFWDVGSNIGIYTLYAAVRHPTVQVLSFEPFFRNFARLHANVHLNDLPNITPLYVALSRDSGIAVFRGQDDRYGASGNVVVSTEGGRVIAESRGRYAVSECVLKASGTALLSLGIKPPHYLKIDVDGIELDIVEGMEDLLRGDDLRSILIEVNNKTDLASVTQIFQRHGLLPDDRFNMLESHSRRRRSRDPKNTAENWVFTRARKGT